MKIILKNGTGEIVEKKSRFIANVIKIENEEQAQEYILALKKKYWDARHNCYAYICGDDGEIQRFSDDGEPSGTAGKPMLEILSGQKLNNCLVVVTRYFGGVLLGTGGLIRAYSAAAKEGINNSIVGECIKGIGAEIVCDYTMIGKVQYICAETQTTILDTEYSDLVKIKILATKENENLLNKKLIDASSGKIMLENIEEKLLCINESMELFLL